MVKVRVRARDRDRVRVRVRVRVIITWYVYVFYEKSHSFTSFSLGNLTVCSKYNMCLMCTFEHSVGHIFNGNFLGPYLCCNRLASSLFFKNMNCIYMNKANY